MRLLILGYFIYLLFEYLFINSYNNNYISIDTTIFTIILKWFFYIYIVHDRNLTCGKCFMSKSSFRIQYLIQIINVIKNNIVWMYILVIFELGTFMVYFVFSLYFIINSFLKLKNQRLFLNICYIVFVISFFKIVLLCNYSWFDYFFFSQPFICIYFLLFYFLYIINIFVHIYILISKIQTKNVAMLFLFMIIKYFFYFFTLIFLMILLLNDLDLHNIVTDNFLKEMAIKLLVFCLSNNLFN